MYDTLLYHYQNNVLLLGKLLQKSEAFLKTGTLGLLFLFFCFSSPRQDSVAWRLSRGMTHTSLPGATPCPSA